MSIREYLDEQGVTERLYAPCDEAAAERQQAEDDAIPTCACGCGQDARLVADVVLATGIDCRAPWVSIEHALGARQDNQPVTIDVIVPVEDFRKIVSAAPCWCGLRLHTTCDWCPAHGAKE